MRAFAVALGLMILPPAFAGVPLTTLAELDARGTPTLAPMLERVTPAVVNISSESIERIDTPLNPLLNDPIIQRFFGVPSVPRERRSQNLGSGVVLDAKKGFVVTNYHVIQKADRIRVTLRDGRVLHAKVLGSDPETDVAIIQVPAEQLSALTLANSDELRVGDFVVAIGNPFGLGQTVTSGIVSAMSRRGLGIEGYEDFIQTDASINPGNSGGALVNLRGELVGINTAIYSPNGAGNVGIGFAIPINMVRDIMEQLVESGEVKRGRLGVSTQDMTPSLAEAFGMEQIQGAVISRVLPGSSADEAGLKAGDVIVEINGRLVKNTADLRNLVGLLRAGQKVELQVVRDGKRATKVARVAPVKEVNFDGGKMAPFLEGAVLAVAESQDDIGQAEGVRVLDVTPKSAAWYAGFRPKDVILSVNRINVESARDLAEGIERGSPRGQFFKIRREDEMLILLIKKQK